MHRAARTMRKLPPPRVRHEPPTLEEAVTAAQSMTDDAEQQAEFAAGLMGVSVEEVRPLLAELQVSQKRMRPGVVRSAAPVHGGAVIVERKIRRVSRAGGMDPIRRLGPIQST